MKHYLAGPMSGLPGYNFSTFDLACRKLRARGLDIRSPHEINHGETPETRGSKPYGDYMRAGLKLLLECDAIILMDGWRDSKGCRTEAWVATLAEMPMFSYLSFIDHLKPLPLELEIATEYLKI